MDANNDTETAGSRNGAASSASGMQRILPSLNPEEDDELDPENIEIVEIVEEKQEQDHLLKLSNAVFLSQQSNDIVSPQEKIELRKTIENIMEEHKMAPYYSWVSKELKWEMNNNLYASWTKLNEEKIKKIMEDQKTAEENEGESEVRERMNEHAQYVASIGDYEKSIELYEKTYEKTVGTSSRIDVLFAILRVVFARKDTTRMKEYIEKVKVVVNNGGDWERKNLLKVYEGTYFMLIRHFSAAAQLFLDSIATFTAYELFDYSQFVRYVCLCSAIAIDRPTMKKKVLDSPEILSSIDTISSCRSFIFSLYQCRYAEFFTALSEIATQIQRDPYLSQHLSYYSREIRIVAYTQFLESYRTATLSSMANAFGVESKFMEDELFRFISSGRLNARIDAVAGVVETCRPDAKNAQYHALMKAGDHLLNRVQKLTKVISY